MINAALGRTGGEQTGAMDSAQRRARAFVDDAHPHAVVALLGGSHGRGAGTPTSDLDVVLVDPDVDWGHRRTWLLADGQKVEEFAYHDRSVLEHFLERERSRRKPTLFSLVGEAVVLVDREGWAADLQRAALVALAAGPPPLDDVDHLMLRYRLTDLHDDLADIDAAALGSLAAPAWSEVASAVLEAHRHWQGTGKWIRRYLDRVEPGRADALDGAVASALQGDRAPIVAQVAAALAALGGRVDETDALVGPRP